MKFRKIIFCFLFLGSYCYAQPTGVLVDFNKLGVGIEKSVLGINDSSLISFGFYLDTTDKSKDFLTGTSYPFIGGFPNNKFISLKKSFSAYTDYKPNYGFTAHKILRLNDSLFAYFFSTIDSGQLYKSSRNWLVKFNIRGDTLSLIELKTNSTFGLTGTLFNKKDNEFYIVGWDTVYKSSGNPFIYKLDSNGNIVWTQTFWAECGVKIKDVIQDNDSTVLLIGNYSLRVSTPQSLCRSRYYFRRYRSSDGLLVGSYICEDSIPTDGDAKIDDADRLANNSIIALAMPLSDMWTPFDRMNSWEVYRDQQQLLLFNQSGHLLKKTILLPGIKNKQLANTFNFITPLRNSGALLIGRFCDSLPESRDLSQSHYGASLMKVDSNLTVEWVRNYRWNSSYLSSYLVDAAEDSRSGFFLGGFANSEYGSLCKAWIVHIDSFGCVITGCQLLEGIQKIDPNTDKKTLMVYPNPVTDKLRVILPEIAYSSGLKLLVLNTEGRIVEEINVKAQQDEYIINCEKFLDGVYYIILKTNELLIAGEKIIKQN